MDRLLRSVVQHSNDLITVFDLGGRIVYMNDASSAVLGAPPSAFVGRNIVEFVHPDEVGQAVKTLELSREYGPPPGNTHFRVRRADQTYVSLEMTSGPASDGTDAYIMTSSRMADTRFALEQAFHQMVGGLPLAAVMSTVCDTFSWRHVDSRIAIAWRGPDERRVAVRTGDLPEILGGAGDEPGSPWQVARATLRGATHLDLSELTLAQREAAEAAGLGAFWVEPVASGEEPAVITVWTAAGGRPPSVHVQGMVLARSIVQVVLRWSDHRSRLDHAAFHDELTGLPNRKHFFRALETTPHGAVLYCDLDRFKPVNDLHGHAAGDAVLREVATRLRSCLRDTDLVARIGGDEFAVLCPGSTAEDARRLSDRIRAAVAAPILLPTGIPVSVGISIGMAHTTDRLDAESLAAADRALYAMKDARRPRRTTG